MCPPGHECCGCASDSRVSRATGRADGPKVRSTELGRRCGLLGQGPSQRR
jgi:hypothetical protein